MGRSMEHRTAEGEARIMPADIRIIAGAMAPKESGPEGIVGAPAARAATEDTAEEHAEFIRE
jgi:hypothetical protein